MANQINIDIGAAANDGTGDPLRTAFNYVNLNFANVWATGLPNSNVQFDNNRVLTVNTNANLVLAPNGTAVVQSNVSILPNLDRVHDIGSASRRWNTVNAYYINAVSANVGSFGNLTVAVANLHITGGSNGYVLQTDGAGNLTWTAQTGGGGNGIPGGANTQVQYNNAGSFGGSASFTFDRTANVLTVAGNISANNASINNLTSSNLVNARTGKFTGDQFSDGAMYIGSAAGTVLGSDVVIQITANSGSYSQTNFQNINSGVTASSDYILTADNGNDSTHFLDMGITSSGWDGSETNALSGLVANNGYLYVQDGNLTVGTRAGNVSHGWNFDTSGTLTFPDNSGSGWPIAQQRFGMGNIGAWLDGEWTIGEFSGNGVSGAVGIRIDPAIEGYTGMTFPSTAASNTQPVSIYSTNGSGINLTTGAYNWTFDSGGSFTLPSSPGNVYFGIESNEPVIVPYNTGLSISANRADVEASYINLDQNAFALITPGSIQIDNSSATSLGNDINLLSGDDIRLAGRNKPGDSESEGGDINIYAGQGADAVTSGFDTGGGGDIQIRGGGGGEDVGGGFGGSSGGFVGIYGGDGGISVDSNAGSGGDITIAAGSAPGVANTALGGYGGTVSINAGRTTRINENGGTIDINSGEASGDGSGIAGYVAINIPASNAVPGGSWIFTGTGRELNVPADSSIYGANFGNFTVGCAGNTIVTSSNYGANVKNWVFGYTGNLLAPGNIITPTNFVGTSLRTNLSDFNWSAAISDINIGTSTIVTLNKYVFGDPWSGQVVIEGVSGTTEANATWWYQAVDSNQFQLYTDNTFETPVDSSTWGAYTSGGNAYTLDYSNIEINGQTITIRSDGGDYNIRQWQFNRDGQTLFPYMDVVRGDTSGGNITGYVLTIGNGTAEAIVSTPDGNATIGSSAQRLVINPGKGADGTAGEGGDIYLWAGRGGDTNGNGGDVKVRGGYGPGNGQGGYIRIEAGDVQGAGTAGYSLIRGGDSGGSTGGYVSLEGGRGNDGNGGYINIQGGGGSVDGGNITIQGGISDQGLAHYGNLIFNSGAMQWRMENTGNLTLPQGGVIYENNIPFGGLAGKTISLAPYGGTSADQQLLVYPTAGPDANHLHLTSGNLYNTELFLGNDDLYVKLANTGNVVINANDSVGNAAQWIFDTTGNLTTPGSGGDITGAVNITASGNITANNVITNSNGQGVNIKVGDDTYLGDINVADTLSIRGQQSGGANAYIVFGNASNVKLGRAGSGPLRYEGDFAANGNISAGNNFQLPVYANATVRDSSIASPTPGMMIYVTGVGMQVRGATSWNTIAGSGT